MLCGNLEWWEVREGTYVYLWLIHVDVWQKPTQYCKAIIFQLKISKFKSIYAQDLGEEESTGLEVAICQTLCQAQGHEGAWDVITGLKSSPSNKGRRHDLGSGPPLEGREAPERSVQGK